VYKSAFGNGKAFHDVPVGMNFHMNEALLSLLGAGDVLCDAVSTAANNETYTIPVPVPEWNRASGVLKLQHRFHAGRYSIIFYTQRDDVGVLLEQTTFEVRIEYYFSPPESYCVPSSRHVGVSVCDQVNIGKGSYHTFNMIVLSKKPWNITVGKFCSISSVTLSLSRTVSHKLNFVTTFPLHQLIDRDSTYRDEIVHGSSHSVNIGNDVWIGMNTILINNVTIGHGAVVGSDSVVRKSIPPYAIAYGNPAVVVRYRFPPAVVEALLRMQWWDWADERILAMARYGTTEEVIAAWDAGEL
jgi:acetyltransferase-like isoleucine patch superfamily enzyme